MTHANKPTPEELRRLFVDLNYTQEMLAAKYGVSQNTAKYWIASAGITKGKPNNDGCDAPEAGSLAGTKPDADELRRLVVDERRSDPWIGSIYSVPPGRVKSWRRSAGLVGVRKNQQTAMLTQIVEEAAQAPVVVEKPKPRPIAPRNKMTFTAEEAALYLVKASQSPFAEHARAAARAMVGRYA